jgi:4-amino-4-deoxychorismate lyase
MNEKWVFLNGNFCLEKEAVIPITDRGFLFGEGIFTTIKVQQGQCELLKNHLQRLKQQAELLNFRWTPDSWGWILELIQRNRAYQGSWRLKILATIKEERTVGNVLATLNLYEETSEPCTLCLFPYPFESPLAHIKSLSYLDHLYVCSYARQRGHTDAITQTGDRFLLETGCSNLFWIDQGQCWVPDPQLPYLKGVFLQAILPHLSLPIQWIKATLDEVPSSASVYICNALTHVRPVLSIDQRSFRRNQGWERLLQKAAMQALQENRMPQGVS